MNFFLRLHFSMTCTYEKSHTHVTYVYGGCIYGSLLKKTRTHTRLIKFFCFHFFSCDFSVSSGLFQILRCLSHPRFSFDFRESFNFCHNRIFILLLFFAVGAQTNEFLANLHSFNVFYLRFSITLHFGLILNCF